ncbi:fog: pas/pac domain [hydrocarbon metagenome]|uniref:histidine kinase n=1 Tax=hydrocarbon metagenome TaxID=938273 RepID=A0A0W8FFC4_9ZZZZ|nr:PAS domain S-box protein [Methanomicrobiaceae archaeon]
MIQDQDRITAIKTLLKKHPRGLTISDLSLKMGLNRNSLAKYLEIMLITGQVEMETYGTAKVYCLSQRVPVSALLKFSTDLIVLVDGDLQIVQVNDNVLSFFALTREDLLEKNLNEISLPPITDLPLKDFFHELALRGEAVRETGIVHNDREVFFRIKLIPTVFDDGGKGATFIMEDITLQKRYERQLQENEARYRAIVEGQTELICRRLPDGTITFVNGAYCRYFGRDSGDLTGQQFRPESPPKDMPGDLPDPTRDPVNPVSSYEQRIVAPDGAIRWLQWTDRALFDPEGHCLEVQSVGRDITERKEAERELRIKESAIASSINGIAIFDPDATLIYANQSYLNLIGCSGDETVGKSIDAQFPGNNELADAVKDILNALQQEGVWSGPLQVRRQDGTEAFLQVSVSQIMDEQDRHLCTMGIVADLTEQKRVEEALRVMYEEHQKAIEFIPDPTFIVDRKDRVVAWNRALEAFTGVGKEQVLGTSGYKDVFSFYGTAMPILVDLIDLPAEEIARSYPDVRRFGEGIFVEAFVPSLHHGRGAYLWGKASRLIDSDGTWIGTIESIRDISDWKKAEDSLRRASEKARRAPGA